MIQSHYGFAVEETPKGVKLTAGTATVTVEKIIPRPAEVG